MANRAHTLEARASYEQACFLNRLARILCPVVLFLLIGSLSGPGIRAQAGGHKLFGDLRVDESQTGEAVPLSYDIILYSRSGNSLQRLSIPNRGRYQFLNLSDGEYFVVVEVENKMVARLLVSVHSPFKTDFRQDIELAWRRGAGQVVKASTISASDFYKRSEANERLFDRGQKDANQKKYEHAILVLRQLLENDPQDFQAWTELGTAYLARQAFDAAEKSYLSALKVRPEFLLANLNLGRLYFLEKKFENSVAVLIRAIGIQPPSADAYYFLGEAYLQLRKGSAAVGCLNEALRLDPQGNARAHLRLALLYHGAGMRDKAVREYEQFLKKKPDYPDRQKLENYIAENKKR
jgi:Flp pilus assembly protein TadD